MKLYNFSLLLLFSLFFVSGILAQTSPQPRQKTISVSGSSEMEIVPDELFFRVVLREYIDKDKKKIKIETLEKELQSAVSSSGVGKQYLQFENVFGERWKEKKGKPEEFLQSRIYIIKLSEPSKIDEILDKIDARGIENVALDHYSHSRQEEFRKELKIQAIKNAKEKANYLLEAIGEKAGGAVSVNENPGTGTGGFYIASNEISNNEYRQFQGVMLQDASSVSFRTIRLRYEVLVEFEIK